MKTWYNGKNTNLGLSSLPVGQVPLVLPEAQPSHQQNGGKRPYLGESVKIVMCASPPSKYSENASDVMCVAACQKAS